MLVCACYCVPKPALGSVYGQMGMCPWFETLQTASAPSTLLCVLQLSLRSWPLTPQRNACYFAHATIALRLHDRYLLGLVK
jgi:hypothetical protein